MPDAPSPVFDSNGNLARSWRVVVVYQPEVDEIIVISTGYDAGSDVEKIRHSSYAPDEIEHAVRKVSAEVRMRGALRLF